VNNLLVRITQFMRISENTSPVISIVSEINQLLHTVCDKHLELRYESIAPVIEETAKGIKNIDTVLRKVMSSYPA